MSLGSAGAPSAYMFVCFIAFKWLSRDGFVYDFLVWPFMNDECPRGKLNVKYYRACFFFFFRGSVLRIGDILCVLLALSFDFL